MSLHKYLYAGSNPASFTDPSGLFFRLPDVMVSLGVAAILYTVSYGIVAVVDLVDVFVTHYKCRKEGGEIIPFYEAAGYDDAEACRHKCEEQWAIDNFFGTILLASADASASVSGTYGVVGGEMYEIGPFVAVVHVGLLSYDVGIMFNCDCDCQKSVCRLPSGKVKAGWLNDQVIYAGDL